MTTESILKTSVLIRDQLTSREKERGAGEREIEGERGREKRRRREGEGVREERRGKRGKRKYELKQKLVVDQT